MLIFVAGTLLVAHAWGVVDTKLATVEAAEQAARTYVEAPNATQAALEAQRAADSALTGFGRNPALAKIELHSGFFARCHRITIAVSYPSPMFDLPFLGRVGSGSLVTADHSELVDPYRSGLPGQAECG
jgi:hypothetical protein